jgi:hypothetical protein
LTGGVYAPHMEVMHTLTHDELATGLSVAGETLERDVWNAVDGVEDALERVTAALADIRRLAPMLEDRVDRGVR